MATPDSTLSALTSIRTKIRRLTRSPSSSQLTDSQIDDYVNTFVLYDFPEFTVDNKLTFFLMPNVDVYETNTVNSTDPLFNFKNVYLSVQKPVYVGGDEIEFTQSREQFFRQYPQYEAINAFDSGDGVTTSFTGTLSTVPALAETVAFTSIDSSGNGIVLKDVARTDGATGIITTTGDLVVPDTGVSVGTINYITGVFSFVFPVAPGSGKDVFSQAYIYQSARPTIVMFEDHKFTFRPIPDKSYRVEIDAFKRPTELLSNTDTPDISQWWQYIAYGASKKVFEDRMDVESVQAIMPEFLRQRSLVLQKLVVQQSSERAATIYSERGARDRGDGDTF